ncbi:MAG: CHAT domain-containing protein, partial [Cyanobacteria bacterium J083]
QNFTKENVKKLIQAQASSIMHLATHGQFGSQAEDTFVITYGDRLNILNLKSLIEIAEVTHQTPIELLVLSACETARGDDRAVLGLAGVASRAGARSVLASLWRVSDAATAKFMERFYIELLKNGKTKAQALRAAQIYMIREKENNFGSHPWFWGSFILIGNWV